MTRDTLPAAVEQFPHTAAATDRSASIRIGLLGGFGMTVGGQQVALPKSAERLVSFLALHGGPRPRSFVAGSLWAETTERHALGSLRSTLWRVGAPAEQLIRSTSTHIQLDPDVSVDHRASVGLAKRVLDRSLPLGDEDLDEAALSADVLPDWTDEWAMLERESFRQLRLRALETMCGRLIEAGRFGQAVQAGLVAVAGDPLRESARRALITAHLADGNEHAARMEYEAFRTLLFDTLRVEPTRALKSLLPQLGSPQLGSK